MKNRLEISDLSLAYGKRTILEHISFTLAAGEAVALCGENGSGKTTLLTAAAGILRPTHGKIRRSGKVGYVPQSAALLEDMTFADNLRYFSAIARARVPQLLPLCADELRPMRVRDMSGGMKKLCSFGACDEVCCGLVLSTKPKLFADTQGIFAGRMPVQSVKCCVIDWDSGCRECSPIEFAAADKAVFIPNRSRV